MPGNIVALPRTGTDQDAGSEDDHRRESTAWCCDRVVLELCLVVEPQGKMMPTRGTRETKHPLVPRRPKSAGPTLKCRTHTTVPSAAVRGRLSAITVPETQSSLSTALIPALHPKPKFHSLLISIANSYRSTSILSAIFLSWTLPLPALQLQISTSPSSQTVTSRSCSNS